MTDPADRPDEDRVLVLAPTARDAALCRRILGDAGVGCAVCPDVGAVCRGLEAGAGAAVLTEEALTGPALDRLAEALGRQPPWSDFPVLVLTRQGEASALALRTLAALGNVTLLERPVRVPTLVSAVRTALRARRRQYQIRGHMAAAGRVAEELREADRRKDEFLAMLAHELRNPLAPIRAGLHILKTAGTGPQTDRVREIMARQVDHLVRLVDDLLDVSRMLRGRVDLRVEPLDLAAVVARAVETVQPLVDAQRHELAVDLPADPLPVRGDPVRLAQVFANLLNNAAKYTEPGGHIRVTGGRDGAAAVVAVRDDGLGIAPDLLPRVFDLFTQAERSLDRSQGGLGLGLTLVKRLLELHGGTVEARSDGPGRGSEFVVRLPLAARPGRAAPAPPAPAAAGPARRVLVVDDNVDAAESLAMVLSLGGHTVLTTHRATAALAAAESFRPDVVLLDIGLPDVDGYEAARRLRRLDIGRVVLVAVTGYGQEEDRRRAREVGFDHHLVKPVDPAALQTLLATAVP